MKAPHSHLGEDGGGWQRGGVGRAVQTWATAGVSERRSGWPVSVMAGVCQREWWTGAWGNCKAPDDGLAWVGASGGVRLCLPDRPDS